LPAEALNPISLNALLFDMNAYAGAGSVLGVIDLTTFWSLAVMAIGYKVWTKTSMAMSIITVTVPYVIFYSAWLWMVS
jgi:hypothetical protein